MPMTTLALSFRSGTRLVWMRRVSQLLVGLFLYGFAIALMVRAGIGVGPWDVLTLGLVAHTGWDYGLLTNIIGAVVLLLWIPIRQRPGVGTVVNVLLIGPSASFGLWLVPQQTEPWMQGLVFAGGLALLSIATGLYIGARLGPGPRDGLMTGLVRRTGWKVWMVRTGIEVTVLVVGWLLGGQVGIGTLAFALLIGPMVNVTLPLLRVPEGPAITDDQPSDVTT
ncbi:membrane protein [soil metagenome]